MYFYNYYFEKISVMHVSFIVHDGVVDTQRVMQQKRFLESPFEEEALRSLLDIARVFSKELSSSKGSEKGGSQRGHTKDF